MRLIERVQSLSILQQLLLIVFFLLKLSLLGVLPLTGDEAYFIQWGKDLSLGYYDHPPMVGWTIWSLGWINDSYYFYRLFAFVSSIVISVLIYKLCLKQTKQDAAVLISLAYFVSPISLFSVLLANDVVLTFFGFCGFYFYQKASEEDNLKLAALAGLLLAMAFLSKYLSAMLFIGLLVYALINFNKTNWKVSVLVGVIVLLAVGENIYYNLQYCWNNILFNLVARTQEGGFEPKNIILFFITFILLISPFSVKAFIQNSKAVQPNKSIPFRGMALAVCISYLLVFLLVSLSKTVGLHWFALMMPFAFVLLSFLPQEKLIGTFNYAAITSIVIGSALLLLVLFSSQLVEALDKKDKQKDLDFYLKTAEICKQLPDTPVIFTTGYSKNSVLAYHCKETQFHVAFDLSKYGREDDKRVNFNDYAGQDLWIVDKSENLVDKVKDYFSQVEVKPLILSNGTEFTLVKGFSFNFELYRENYLKPICEQFYSVPDWLPKARCRVKEKYGLSQ